MVNLINIFTMLSLMSGCNGGFHKVNYNVVDLFYQMIGRSASKKMMESQIMFLKLFRGGSFGYLLGELFQIFL